MMAVLDPLSAAVWGFGAGALAGFAAGGLTVIHLVRRQLNGRGSES